MQWIILVIIQHIQQHPPQIRKHIHPQNAKSPVKMNKTRQIIHPIQPIAPIMQMAHPTIAPIPQVHIEVKQQHKAKIKMLNSQTILATIQQNIHNAHPINAITPSTTKVARQSPNPIHARMQQIVHIR